MIMQKIKISILAAIVALFSNCSDKSASAQVQLTTFKDSLSYSFGALLAEQIKPQLEDIDIAMATAAFREALSDTSQLTMEQCQQVYMTFNERKTENLAEEGVAFLQENASKEGVETTASGFKLDPTFPQGASTHSGPSLPTASRSSAARRRCISIFIGALD